MKGLKPWDYIAALLVLALAAGIYLVPLGGRGTGLQAEIRQDGKLVRTLDLSALQGPEQWVMQGQQVENTLRAESGRICVLQATCPGQDCVHSGWLTKAGQSAICLENRLSITLVARQGAGPDAVAG